MPRLPPWLIRQAKQQSPNLAALLPACRDLGSARNELRWLGEHVAQMAPARQRRQLARLCRERGRGVPLQYILASQPFDRLDIKCRPGVLIPRPETEAYTCHLADLVVSRAGLFGGGRALNVVDFCTGTGCIPLLLFSLLQASFDGLNVLGVDIAREAVELARENIDRNTKLGLIGRPGQGQSLRISRRDVFDDTDMRALARGQWDVLVANPPYVSRRVWDCGSGQLGYSVRKFEPRLALVPGPHLPVPEGWERQDAFYARLLDQAALLGPKVVVLELGGEAQARRVLSHLVQHPLSRSSRLELWRDWPDLAPAEEEAAGLDIVGGRGQVVQVPAKGSGQIRCIYMEKNVALC